MNCCAGRCSEEGEKAQSQPIPKKGDTKIILRARAFFGWESIGEQPAKIGDEHGVGEATRPGVVGGGDAATPQALPSTLPRASSPKLASTLPSSPSPTRKSSSANPSTNSSAKPLATTRPLARWNFGSRATTDRSRSKTRLWVSYLGALRSKTQSWGSYIAALRSKTQSGGSYLGTFGSKTQWWVSYLDALRSKTRWWVSHLDVPRSKTQ